MRNLKCTKVFLDKLESLNVSYLEISFFCSSIEAGDFSKAEGAILNKEKLSYSFWVTLNNRKNKMLVGIYYKRIKAKTKELNENAIEPSPIITKDPIENYAYQRICFFDILTDKDSEETIEKAWVDMIALPKYPKVKYDDNGQANEMDVVFRKKKVYHGFALYSLYDTIPIKSKDYLCKVLLKGAAYDIIANDPNDFIHDDVTHKILQATAYQKNHCEVSKMIASFLVTQKEKGLIELNMPFVISGKPGTGKTKVMIYKLLSIFLNLQFNQSAMVNDNEIKWDYIKSNFDINDIRKQYRIVFPSFNQYHCDSNQEHFVQLLNQITNNNGNSNNSFDYPINLISKQDSFRDVKVYPLFANFKENYFHD